MIHRWPVAEGEGIVPVLCLGGWRFEKDGGTYWLRADLNDGQYFYGEEAE